MTQLHNDICQHGDLVHRPIMPFGCRKETEYIYIYIYIYNKAKKKKTNLIIFGQILSFLTLLQSIEIHRFSRRWLGVLSYKEIDVSVLWHKPQFENS